MTAPQAKLVADNTSALQAKQLDQFYTAPSVAKLCTDILLRSLPSLGEDVTFIEPSAGQGVFYDALTEQGVSNIKAYDIAPKHDCVEQADFLSLPDNTVASWGDRSTTIIIGNPPFGRRSSLAIDFLNLSAAHSDFIAFIVPVQFRKWSVQSKVDKSLKLVSDTLLREDAFIHNGKPYSVRCCFQIWQRTNKDVDLRLISPPLIKHDDFEMYQYNATVTAEKALDKEFDFAVYRQGYKDFTQKFYNKSDLDKKSQWILFKAKSKAALDILLSIDFDRLSKLNTSTYGFGKADVVHEYARLKNNT